MQEALLVDIVTNHLSVPAAWSHPMCTKLCNFYSASVN